ncbi:hypothetical protein C0991_004019, partial [Blastosporella zonata]
MAPPPTSQNPFSTLSPSARSRPASRASHLEFASSHHCNRDTSLAPPTSYPASTGLGMAGLAGQRGSMLLYCLASDNNAPTPPTSSSVSSRNSAHLLPQPKLRDHPKNRDSTSSGISFASLDSQVPPETLVPLGDNA